MNRFNWTNVGRCVAAAMMCAAGFAGSARGQLPPIVVTEIMSNPLSANDNAWEWMEIVNTTGAPIDLNGFIIDRLNDNEFVEVGIDGALAETTIVPAGAVAILYDADLDTVGDFDEAAFRSAWGLSPSVPLIGVSGDFGDGLTNSGGTAVGFWPNVAAYQLDTNQIDMDAAEEVSQFTNALFYIDFRTADPPAGPDFPNAPNGRSLRWKGVGDITAGANWEASTAGMNGAVTSTAVNVMAPLNDTDDVANPGIFPSGTPATPGIYFTEIMYNPRSAEPDWEWVEIFNAGNSPVDLTGYVFHDTTTASDLTAANVGVGSQNPGFTLSPLGVGEGAVLFNGDELTVQNMIDAWDPGGARGTKFIPVGDFPALNQGGDTIALWDSKADYDVDSADPSPRRIANAIASVAYDDEQSGEPSMPTDWPSDDGFNSIYLTDLSLDVNNGLSWQHSLEEDGAQSFLATAVVDTIALHPGGDVGSPGEAPSLTPPTNDADFDDSGRVDGRDFLIWQRHFGGAGTAATGDATGDGLVDAADFAEWKAKFGGAPASGAAAGVPEPGAIGLAALGLAALCGARRQRRG